jgi:hypothetical protein
MAAGPSLPQCTKNAALVVLRSFSIRRRRLTPLSPVQRSGLDELAFGHVSLAVRERPRLKGKFTNLMAISANQEIASSDEISSPVAGLNVLSQEPALARTRALLFIRGASLGNFEAPNGATNDNGKLSL